MKQFIVSSCGSAYRQMQMIRCQRTVLDKSSTTLLVNSLVLSRLDYCCSLLTGSSLLNLDKMQRVINLAARTVSRCRRYDHISPILRDLKWLRMQERIKLRVATLVFKVIIGRSPSYLRDCIIVHQPVRDLRSGSALRLVPRISRGKIGQLSFLHGMRCPLKFVDLHV